RRLLGRTGQRGAARRGGGDRAGSPAPGALPGADGGGRPGDALHGCGRAGAAPAAGLHRERHAARDQPRPLGGRRPVSRTRRLAFAAAVLVALWLLLNQTLSPGALLLGCLLAALG